MTYTFFVKKDGEQDFITYELELETYVPWAAAELRNEGYEIERYATDVKPIKKPRTLANPPVDWLGSIYYADDKSWAYCCPKCEGTNLEFTLIEKTVINPSVPDGGREKPILAKVKCLTCGLLIKERVEV